MITEAKKTRCRIGLLPTGHKIYWSQFPELKVMGMKMYDNLVTKLGEYGEVIAPELVDTKEKAIEAASFFKTKDIDILYVFPLGYTTGMCVVPVVRELNVPIRLLNAHQDASFDVKNADTAMYLYHEGICCIPEYAGTLVDLGKKFKVVTGHFGEDRLWNEIRMDCVGAMTATAFKKMNFAVAGSTYTNMTDMPIDEHRLLKATGKLLIRPEVEEFEEAQKRVTPEKRQRMLEQIKAFYDLDETVTDDDLTVSADAAVAFDEIIEKYDIDAFGYYWWGEKAETIELRAQSAIAVSRLAALGRPGVTEGDVKTAIAMKIIDIMGGGGMFLEFASMDFIDDFIMLSHDGPSNVNLAEGKPLLKFLDIHHGKTGSGLGIDFNMKKGPCTLVNFTQFGTSKTFKIIYSVAEIIDGDLYNIGNPNCKIKLKKPIHEFINDWCQQGPNHHFALGTTDLSRQIETFAESLDFEAVRV